MRRRRIACQRVRQNPAEVDATPRAFYGSRVAHPLGGKTTIAVAVMLALLAVPYASPKLSRLRIARAPWDREQPTDVAAAQPSPTSTPLLTQGETTLKASQNQATVTNALPDSPRIQELDPKVLAKTKGSLAVEDDTGKALDAFYMQLARTRAKKPGAVTRVMHYGDSVVTSDYITGTMRRKMQAEFGDAGHGFLLVANPWEWYFHNDVGHGASEGWRSSRIVGPLTGDGMYGLGGVTFTGATGASAWFSTSEKTSYGKKVSRFDVYYLETPNGGDVEVKLAGKTETFSTKGEGKASRVKSFSCDDGEAKLTLRVVSGSPRLFGVALERDQPGVVYDALGTNGGRSEHWGPMDAQHWADQMALRKPALVVLQYGTNESETGVISSEQYEKTLRSVIEKVKVAAPGASILVAAPLDRAETKENGAMRTKPIIKKLVASQRNAAKDTGVAFWNTFEAMGGEGSMATWVKKGLAGGDLTHPSPQGAEVIGDLLFKSLSTGFEAWLSRHPDAAAAPAPAARDASTD
jgi:lysophospholipase L1-like esterase